MTDCTAITVEAVWRNADGQVQEITRTLAPGSTLQQALQACGDALPTYQAAGIWGKTKPLEHVLQHGDRVELYQSLKVDPKLARRERFAKQGARGAGLFATRRVNSKSGY